MIKTLTNYLKKYVSVGNKSNFETDYKVMENVYRYILLNPFNRDGLKAKHITMALFGLFFPIIAPFLSIISFANNPNDIHEIVMCFITIFTAAQSVSKIFVIVIYYSDYNNLRDIVIEKTNLNNISDPNVKQIVENYQVRVHKYLVLIIIAYFGSLSSIVIFPIVSEQTGLLPLTIKIPGVSRTENTGYLIHYGMSTFDTIYVLLFLIAYDGIVVLNAVYITCQLKICGYYFSKIGEFDAYECNTSVEKQTSVLKSSIKFQQETIEFIRIIEKVYSVPVLMQLIATTFSLCISLLRMRIVRFK